MVIPLLILASHSVALTPAQDTSILAVAVYEAVLEHAAARYPSRPGLPVVIAERAVRGRCAPFCVDTTFVDVTISNEDIQRLKDKNLIVAACREPERTIGCPFPAEHTFIRLGIPYRTPARLRVRAGEGRPDAILRIGDPQPDTEFVEVGVDVLIFGSCPPERSPCEFPDIELYTYFLRATDRSYRVVARMLTGAV